MQREWLPTPAAQEPGSPRYGRLVTALLSPEAFYDSARGFAATALQAHHTRDYGRVTADAGTALEHLAKACLAKRSAVLLCGLRGRAQFRGPIHPQLCHNHRPAN
jgi:hypothetical protein